MRPKRDLIREFIQGTLGCGCPEEVFEHVEERAISWAGVPGRRITVGDRLLVAVFETDDPRLAVGRVAAWVADGRRARDAEGLNRLRVVIAGGRPAELEVAVRPVFDAAPERDDRVHLHVLDRRLYRLKMRGRPRR
jgi:hypothetical protein